MPQDSFERWLADQRRRTLARLRRDTMRTVRLTLVSASAGQPRRPARFATWRIARELARLFR